MGFCILLCPCAAFDTTDDGILSESLPNRLGLQDSSLVSLESYEFSEII